MKLPNSLIQDVRECVLNCPLPHKYFMTYDFHLGNRFQHDEFIREYLWNGLSRRLRTKVRVYAVGLNPIGKIDHFHAIITTNKPINEFVKVGDFNVPLLYLIDAMFEFKHKIGRYVGDDKLVDDLSKNSVIMSQNQRFTRLVPFGGNNTHTVQVQALNDVYEDKNGHYSLDCPVKRYKRSRIKILEYKPELGGVGYTLGKHEVVLAHRKGSPINEFGRKAPKPSRSEGRRIIA
jgi:hypothetical protein